MRTEDGLAAHLIPGCALRVSAAWCHPTTRYDPEGLCFGETRWPQIKMLTKSVVRVLFNQKTKDW